MLKRMRLTCITIPNCAAGGIEQIAAIAHMIRIAFIARLS